MFEQLRELILIHECDLYLPVSDLMNLYLYI